MKKYVSKIIMLCVVFFPFTFLVALSFVGKAVPIEGKMVENTGFLTGSVNDVEVVFFGYVGCSFICPNSLFTLGEVLDEIHQEDNEVSLGGIFVDVNARTQIKRSHEYSQYFSSTISGFNVTEEELRELKAYFGLNVYGKDEHSSEITHTDHFFVLKRVENQWRVEKVISNQIGKDGLREAILEQMVQNKSIQIASR